jgi:hypothetical protein
MYFGYMSAGEGLYLDDQLVARVLLTQRRTIHTAKIVALCFLRGEGPFAGMESSAYPAANPMPASCIGELLAQYDARQEQASTDVQPTDR